jgi:hypothetical protein
MINEKIEKAENEKSIKKTKKVVRKKEKIDIKKFDDLEGKFLHVKVGDYDHPASIATINDIQEKIVDLFNDRGVDCLVFVTHHAVSMKIIEREKNGK